MPNIQRTLIILSATVLMAPQLRPESTPFKQFKKGDALFKTCQAAIRIQDKVPVAGDVQNGAICGAYLLGFIDALDPRPFNICLPNPTFETIARVYVAYLEKNPKHMDSPISEVLLRSLIDAYPCPVTQ